MATLAIVILALSLVPIEGTHVDTSCADRSSYCAAEECSSQPKYAREFCQRTCRLCNVTTPPVEPAVRAERTLQTTTEESEPSTKASKPSQEYYNAAISRSASDAAEAPRISRPEAARHESRSDVRHSPTRQAPTSSSTRLPTAHYRPPRVIPRNEPLPQEPLPAMRPALYPELPSAIPLNRLDYADSLEYPVTRSPHVISPTLQQTSVNSASVPEVRRGANYGAAPSSSGTAPSDYGAAVSNAARQQYLQQQQHILQQQQLQLAAQQASLSQYSPRKKQSSQDRRAIAEKRANFLAELEQAETGSWQAPPANAPRTAPAPSQSSQAVEGKTSAMAIADLITLLGCRERDPATCARISPDACAARPGYYLKLCPVKCRNCSGLECYDSIKVDCEEVLLLGGCRLPSAAEYCPRTCNLCPSSVQAQPLSEALPCSDQLETCAHIAEAGVCNHPYSRTALQMYCPRSCGFCGRDESPVPPLPLADAHLFPQDDSIPRTASPSVPFESLPSLHLRRTLPPYSTGNSRIRRAWRRK